MSVFFWTQCIVTIFTKLPTNKVKNTDNQQHLAGCREIRQKNCCNFNLRSHENHYAYTVSNTLLFVSLSLCSFVRFYVALKRVLVGHWSDWLRIQERIQYKLCVLVFKCKHSLSPAYLSEQLQQVAQLESRQRLRSSSSSAFVVPATRTSTFGDRSFSAAGLK